MKVGFVISHLAVRKDLSALLLEMSRQGVSPVVFSSDLKDQARLPKNVEFRHVSMRKGLKARWILEMQRIFGKTPRSRNNFAYSSRNKFRRLPFVRRHLAQALLWIRCHLLGFVPAEIFLDALASECAADTTGLSGFLLSTPCLDPASWSIARSSRLPCHYYIYSWDHPGKIDSLPTDGARYMTWSSSFSKDLAELCDIDLARIQAVGSTQLTQVHSYLHSNFRCTRTDAYVYYGCAWGPDGPALEELQGLKRIAGLINRHFPGLKLVVRPYVMRIKNTVLAELQSEPGVEFDSWFGQDLGPVELDEPAVFHRLSLQDHAVLFVHSGTTMGFEGAHLSSPIAFLGPEWYGEKSEISKGQRTQEHFRRHLFDTASPNHIKSDEELIEAIRLSVAGNSSMSAYSRRLRLLAAPLPMRVVVKNIRQAMQIA